MERCTAFSEVRLRSFTICKQVCIVLAGTSFARSQGEVVPEPHVESNKEPNETNTSHSGIRLFYLCLAKKIETVTQNGCNYNQG